MKEQHIITNHCTIRNNRVILNGKEDYCSNENSGFPDFIKSVYSHYQIDYPKFFKMDNLSKLGFLTGELLLHKRDLSKYANEEIGMVIANSSSCLDTDEKYYETIKNSSDYFPSPSVFVYTLPNIMIGELCIKYTIKGENAFFILENFDTDFIADYIANLLDSGKIKTCIAGWVDVYHDKYEAMLCLIEKESNASETKGMVCNAENIKKIYLHKNNP